MSPTQAAPSTAMSTSTSTGAGRVLQLDTPASDSNVDAFKTLAGFSTEPDSTVDAVKNFSGFSGTTDTDTQGQEASKATQFDPRAAPFVPFASFDPRAQSEPAPAQATAPATKAFEPEPEPEPQPEPAPAEEPDEGVSG